MFPRTPAEQPATLLIQRTVQPSGHLSRWLIGALVLLVFVASAACHDPRTRPPRVVADDVRHAELGSRLFFDRSLSEPAGTSCASCHEPQHGFSGNHEGATGVTHGSRPGAVGLRNTPGLTYVSFVPLYSAVGWWFGRPPRGGLFLDGRSDSLEDQAAGPLLAADEMNNPSAAAVVAKVARAPYADAFIREFGTDFFADPQRAFPVLMQALAAFERSPALQSFSSRYDRIIQGYDTWTAAEQRGMALFFDPAKGNCVACHQADPGNPDPRASLFTDFTYHQLAVPRNLRIPRNADPGFHDLGLGGPLRPDAPTRDAAAGAFRTPSLRNAARRTAFMHNGVFSTLDEVVAFYATRDSDPTRWYHTEEFDDLPPRLRAAVDVETPPFGAPARLQPTDVADLVAFLATLGDEPVITPMARSAP